MSGEIEMARALNADSGLALLAILGGYALGCLNAGYYWVRWRTGRDVRAHGSGNAGARNAGRLLGRNGFWLVLTLDFLKGIATVAFARWLHAPAWSVAFAGVAVMAGHVWPVQLGFRGGKGVATSLGVLLIHEPRLILVVATLAAIGFVCIRRFS
jgi:glycerol-3-phosphate acyltransferase PlsY